MSTNTTGARTYTVRARRWEHGWELHIDGEGVTQARTLATADRMVRDWLATTYDSDDFSDAVIDVVPEIEAADRIEDARRATRAAAAAQRAAAEAARSVVADLRAQGFSVADIAAVLGVTRGRVSQLLAS